VAVEDQASDPIPREFCDAFNAAISAYLVWSPGEPEPQVRLNQTPFLISTICDFVTKFQDPMPEGLWHVLATAPGSSGEVGDRSYASAARYLAELIRERRKQFAQLGKQDGESARQ
jgi:hypothetical protein